MDNRRFAEARTTAQPRTKRLAVNEALAESIQRREQQEILSLFGTIDYDPAYDYKRERRRRRGR